MIPNIVIIAIKNTGGAKKRDRDEIECINSDRISTIHEVERTEASDDIGKHKDRIVGNRDSFAGLLSVFPLIF